jgi:hypothetical protein
VDLTVRTETLGSGNQTWLGSAHGTSSGRTITLDKSTFTSGTHYPNGYLPSGTPISRITATGKYGIYDNATVGGQDVLSGFLLTDVPVPSEDIDPQGVLFEHGVVIEALLPVALADASGKTDVAGRIIFR